MNDTVTLYVCSVLAASAEAAGASVYGPTPAAEPPTGAPVPDVVQTAPLIIRLGSKPGVSSNGPYVVGAIPPLETTTVYDT